jgi:hypothetical protein
MSILSLLLISLSWFIVPDTSINGVKIVTRQVTGAFSDTRTEYLTANRLRNEWQTHYGDRAGSPMASIIQRANNRVFVMDLQAHEYITYETDSQGEAVGVKPRPVEYSGGMLQIWIDSVDTGERQEIFGHVARHIITLEKRLATPGACAHNSESRTDGWYIDDAAMPDWRRAKKNSVAVAVLVSAGAGNCKDKTDRIDVHRTGVEPGFPLKTNTTTKSEIMGPDGSPRIVASNSGSEVTQFFEGPLDPALFEIPGDFRRVDALKNWYSPAPRLQLTGWEWFREKLQEFFR